jgi:hypothetical protein
VSRRTLTTDHFLIQIVAHDRTIRWSSHLVCHPNSCPSVCQSRTFALSLLFALLVVSESLYAVGFALDAVFPVAAVTLLDCRHLKRACFESNEKLSPPTQQTGDANRSTLTLPSSRLSRPKRRNVEGLPRRGSLPGGRGTGVDDRPMPDTPPQPTRSQIEGLHKCG